MAPVSTRRIPPAGDPFHAVGKHAELLEALAEGEANQGRPHTPREREAFARGFFGEGYRQGTREVRECRSCYGSGSVLEDAEYNIETGELVQVICECPICEGVGSVSVFLYAPPRHLS
jgi:DnaJ-class molecular chaperone